MIVHSKPQNWPYFSNKTNNFKRISVSETVPNNPEVIQENTYLSYAYEFFNFSSSNDFLLFLGAGVFFIVVFGLGLKSLTIYGIARFSHMRNYSISTKLLQAYLARPYSWFLNRHSADLGKTILTGVQQRQASTRNNIATC